MFSEKIFYRAADYYLSEMWEPRPHPKFCKFYQNANHNASKFCQLFSNAIFLNVRIHQIYFKLDLKRKLF